MSGEDNLTTINDIEERFLVSEYSEYFTIQETIKIEIRISSFLFPNEAVNTSFFVLISEKKT